MLVACIVIFVNISKKNNKIIKDASRKDRKVHGQSQLDKKGDV